MACTPSMMTDEKPKVKRALLSVLLSRQVCLGDSRLGQGRRLLSRRHDSRPLVLLTVPLQLERWSCSAIPLVFAASRSGSCSAVPLVFAVEVKRASLTLVGATKAHEMGHDS